MEVVVLRAFRFTLDPTPAQTAHLAKHVGAARNAFNYAVAAKQAAHAKWLWLVARHVEAGVREDVARKLVRVPTPAKPAIQKAYQRARGDSRTGSTGGVFPWWHEVSTHAMQSAMIDADTAWRNWHDSMAGRRAGAAAGYPRFRKKGRSRDSFRLHHDVKRPTIRTDGYRRLRFPSLGSIRVHDSAKRLVRAVERGDAVVQSVTISRRGSRWYASVLCKMRQAIPDRPTKRQRRAGTVGVDLGQDLPAVVSQPLDVGGPGRVPFGDSRHRDRDAERLARARRALSRTQKGSNRRRKAAQHVGALHHRVAERRTGALHQATRRLAEGFALVAVGGPSVPATRRPRRGSGPGRNSGGSVRPTPAAVDVSPSEFRRQLSYKTTWYGSALAIIGRGAPTDQTCSACGSAKPKLPPAERDPRCETCGFALDRVNAARNTARLAELAAVAAAAPDAVVGAKSPSSSRPRGTTSESGRDDAGRPHPSRAGPPRRSNPPTIPSTAVPTGTHPR